MLEKTETNSNSIISLTLGILSILIPFIGLVLGIIGVIVSRKATKEIGKTNEAGKGLAISGLICSMAGTILQTLVVLGYIAYNTITTIS
ncbi:DUF4190 domain-containing protein [Virgibacillus ainsalahensis]